MSGAEPLLLAALAGGTAMDYMGKKQATRDRRNILNRAFEDTQKTTDKATQLVTDEGAKYRGDQRLQDMQGQEAATFAQSQKDLQGAGAGGNLIGTAGDSGAVSGDFLKAKADKALSEGDRMTSIARELAKTRAPSLLRQEEGQRQADIAGRTGSMWGTNRNMTQAASLDAQSVTEPWWGTMGKLAQQAALMYMMGGAGGAGAGAGASGAWSTGGNAAGYGAALA